jgi:dihydrofolate reductase
MKKIILSVAVSLDGFIEGPSGEYDWCPPPSEKEMNDFLGGIDTIFMGRKSYEVAGASMFPDKTCYVFSSTMKSTKEKNVKLIVGDLPKEVHAIQDLPGKNIWLFGGASLTTTFINNNWVDEMWLGLVPILLGSGKPLFQGIEQRKHFKTAEVKSSNGYVSWRLAKA